MVKKLFASSLLILCLSNFAQAQVGGYYFVPDCKYDNGAGQTTFRCTDSTTYCGGIGFPLRLGSSVDYVYRRCTSPQCNAVGNGLKQCETYGARTIDFNCGGSDQCSPYGYGHGGYTKSVCDPVGGSYVDYFDCCDCDSCA